MHLTMSAEVARLAQNVIDNCLCKRTRAAARTITRFYGEQLRATGLRPSQMEVLVTIAAQGELSISALSAELSMDRTTLTRNLRPLEKRGLVAMSPDGRTRLARLTPAGEAVLAATVALWEGAQAAMERSLGEAGVTSVRQAAAAIAQSTYRLSG